MNVKSVSSLLIILLSSHAFAQLSTNVGVYSDYVWRGISQTDEDPALQAGVDYEHDSGFYLGFWGSNVDKPLDVELDGYFGFAKESESGFAFDIGYILYHYRGTNGANFDEIYLGLSYKVFEVKYSRDLENDNGYLEGAFNIPLGNDFGLELHYGATNFDFGTDYDDYKVGFSKDWGGFSFELAYTDTDIDNVPIADGRVVFGVTKTWSFAGK